jgi:hypothetical protein
MPLTAKSDDGSVIRAFDRGITEAVCRDPECAAKVIAVKPYVVDDLVQRVGHWRHVISAERTCPTYRLDQDHMTEWHMAWQDCSDDSTRIEVPLHDKRADIVTRFDWVIEVQHSGISPKQVASRESAHHGRVLWLVDAVTESAPFHVTLRPEIVEVIGPAWMHKSRTMLALDTGQAVVVLPRYFNQRPWTVGANLEIPRALCVQESRVTFTDKWINGDLPPASGSTMRTQWIVESRRPVIPTKPKSEDEIQRVEDDWECHFDGDRTKLVWEGAPTCVVCDSPLLINIPGRETCAACAGPKFLLTKSA